MKHFQTVWLLFFAIAFAEGKDASIAIHRTLQHQTEAILDKVKAELNATEVLAMVMGAKSGAMLAMASSNRYDPSYTPKFANYLYEPGAVIMPIVMAIGVDAKKLLPRISRFARHGRVLEAGAATIKDKGVLSNKPLTLEDVLAGSSNIGIAESARRIDGKTLYEGLVRFGFAQQSGIDLPSDRAGHIKDAKRLETDIYRISAGLGYGLLVTPMHLLKAYAAFANDGKMPTPHIVNDNSFHTTTVISPKTADTIKRMLIETVERGTGHKATTQGLRIGGKTGTAHIAKRGKYTHNYHSSFYGFVEDKYGHSYTIGVLVIEPKTPKMYFASRSSVPVFKRIVDAMAEQKLLNPSVKNPTVAIDVGHGGKDRGAVSSSGTDEYTLNLELAHMLQKTLRKQGVKSVLINDHNQSLPLKQRLVAIRQSGATLLLSIHHGALRFDQKPMQAHGYGLFVSSLSSAYAQSKRLAETIDDAAYRAGLKPSRHYLRDHRLIGKKGVYDFENLYMLKHAAMPSVHIACDFIDTPEESNATLRQEHHRRTARAIAKAVQTFIGQKNH